ncbi:MAG: MFS transporter [Acidobacteria bacterium]|nr:MFS transporter [Acidobacteriota bacterium]
MRRRLPPALRLREFALLWTAVLTMRFADAMVAVAVGWQVYAIHRNPLDLGLVGLAEFIPLPLLALPAGHLSDRFPRRTIGAVAIGINVTIVALLLVVTVHGARALWPFLALAALSGVAAVTGSPALSALTPEIVPTELLPGAVALRSVAGQIAIVAGQAVGGLLFAISAEVVYAVAVTLLCIALVAVLGLRHRPAVVTERAPGFDELVAGVRFVLRTRILLGAIALDLFAVLFGGAVALLPVYARTILDVGPVGLGVLRTAPAVGALAAAVILARRPLRRPAGPTLLLVVAIFGVAIVVFGLSQWFPLSLVALGVSGFADMISVNIRSTTAALVTPNELRGRVLAVEWVFISASNELGAFESGVVASLVGTMTTVVAGGLATIGIALSWTRLFPSLARMGRLEDLRPEPV